MILIRKYDSFEEPLNEEIFGAIGKMLGNLFKKTKERINKTKGGKEIEAIYQKYLTQINDQFSKQAGVELNIAAAANETGEKPVTPEVKENKLFKFKDFEKINEADDVDAKTAVDQLKKKKTVLDQIVNKLKEMALKEMDAILKKYGGSAKNPQLEIIINSKKDQFELDYMNAQINFLEKSGDKTMSAQISKERDVVMKKVEADFKNFDTAKPVEYKVGDTVIYLLNGKKKEEYDSTKKPEEQKNIVGVKKIEKIEGDNITFLNKKGKEFLKTLIEIIGKSEGGDKSEESKKAAEALGKIKTDPEKMNKVAKFADFLQNDANKDKVAEIEKILGGDATV
jgi:hypothetical protein